MIVQAITLDAGLYDNIECKQETSGLLGYSRHLYGHQNTARKTGTHLKRRHWTIPVSCFVIRSTRVDVFFCAAL
ncbi:hypothetical protein TNCV_1822231 [Trichonephila clavipes]|nr:hypothetical protein TNCV_1822231 [Trichonephila clavipes]